MDCTRFSDAISAHVAGAAVTSALRAHLTRCEICRAEVERRRAALTRIDVELASAFRLEPSPDFLARVRSRLATDPATSRSILGWRVAVAAASVAVVILAVGLFLLPGSSKRGSGSSTAAAPRSLPRQATLPTPAPDARTPAPKDSSPLPASATRRMAPHRVRAALAVNARSEEPEVLVPASQRIAIRELMQMLNAGTLDEKILAEPKEITHSDVSVTPIVVEEVAVPAITIRSAVERRP